jgi:hypothetical protein
MTISRVRRSPGGYDEYGDPVESTTTTSEIEGAFVAPRLDTSLGGTGEVMSRGRAGVIVGLTLYAPYGVDLTRDDQIDVDGVRYDIEGEPGAWKNGLTGWAAGIEAALRRAEG